MFRLVFFYYLSRSQYIFTSWTSTIFSTGLLKPSCLWIRGCCNTVIWLLPKSKQQQHFFGRAGGQNGKGNAHDSSQHGIRSSLITLHNKLEFQGGAFDFTQGRFPQRRHTSSAWKSFHCQRPRQRKRTLSDSSRGRLQSCSKCLCAAIWYFMFILHHIFNWLDSGKGNGE